MINQVSCIIFLRKGFPNDDVLNHPNLPKKKILVDEEDSLIGVISSTEIRKRVQINFA